MEAYIVLAIALIPVFLWIRKGRRYGYRALAERTVALNGSGIESVYLLRLQGRKHALTGHFVDSLDTGYLAHIQEGSLIIEQPWWKVMAPFDTIRPQDNIPIRTIESDERVWPRVPYGFVIGDNTFTVCGINAHDPSLAGKELTRLSPQYSHELNRTKLIAELRLNGFLVG